MWTVTGLIACAATLVISLTSPVADARGQRAETPFKVESKNEIHGYVYTLASGTKQFLPEVTVHAKNRSTGLESEHVETNCDGSFVLPALPNGSYDVCWSKPGFLSSCGSSPVNVASETSFPQPYQIVKQAGVVVSGSVTLAGGALPRFVDATFDISETAGVAVLDAATLDAVAFTDTSCRGDFTFAGLAPGSYLVRATYGGESVSAPAVGGVTSLELANGPPTLSAVTASIGSQGVRRASPGSTVEVTVEASDPDSDPLTYRLEPNGGTVVTGSADGGRFFWTLPEDNPAPQLQVLVDDGRGGFDRTTFTLSTDDAARFSGVVLGEGSKPLADVDVRVGSRETKTDANGWFEALVYGDTSRVVLTLQSRGYMLFSRTYDAAQIGRTYQLTRAEPVSIDPRQPALAEFLNPETGRSASVRFAPNTLVDSRGAPAPGPLDVYIGIVEPSDPDAGMPGDFLGTSGSSPDQDDIVALRSFGAVSISIEDAAGTEYNLAPNTTAQVRIPVPTEKRETDLPPQVPLWIFNETSGYWEKVSQATLDGDAYVGDVPHFSEINADIDLTNPVCTRILVDDPLDSMLAFDILIEVPSTGDVFTRQIDNPVNSLYALPAATAVDLTVLDSAGDPIPGTTTSYTTGPYDPSCATNPPYPYSCCTSTATLDLPLPATSGFLDFATVGTSDVFEALWYTMVTDPLAALGAGTVSSSGTAVAGSGTSFDTFFVPGDLLRTPSVSGAGTVDSSLGSRIVDGTGTAFTSFLQVGDILVVGTQTRVIEAINSDIELRVNSPFDPALSGALYDRVEVRMVESVASATGLTVNVDFNHPPTASGYEKVGVRPTLDDWETANSFVVDAEAAYYNGGDLGFGRYMKMSESGGDVAYAVANYGTPGIFDPGAATLADLAKFNPAFDTRFATVTMEHTPNDLLAGASYTKFSVYDGTGRRVIKANLDGLGDKFVPRLCVVCHGGNPTSADSRGEMASEFLPFDLPGYRYSALFGSSRAAQEADFKELNRAIRDHTTPTAAVQEMIEGSYGGPLLPLTTFDDFYVPAAWNGTTDQREIYDYVVKPSCRGCHVTRDSPIDWADYADFDAFTGLIQYVICDSKDMPNALLTYQNFWLNTAPHFAPGSTPYPVNVLANNLPSWNAATPCP